jgi:ribosome biogenesis GTPase / thiamine phosphate phosphatase
MSHAEASPPDRLLALGANDELLRRYAALAAPSWALARVGVEHRGGWILEHADGTQLAQLSGKLRLAVQRREQQRPVVGDWVAFEPTPGDFALIHAALPRRSVVSRRAASGDSEQVLVANVDAVLVCVALGNVPTLRGLERYLSAIHEGGARPCVVLTKADRVDDTAPTLEAIRAHAPGVPVLAVSVLSGAGLEVLDAFASGGQTLVLVGASGVGKSTLVNRWLGAEALLTQGTRDADDKGRHTTTARHLFVLPSGAVVIDTPGMREFGVWEAPSGIELTFVELEAIASRCRFRDCAHGSEPGCALREAVARGEVDAARLEAWRGLKQQPATARRRPRR